MQYSYEIILQIARDGMAPMQLQQAASGIALLSSYADNIILLRVSRHS